MNSMKRDVFERLRLILEEKGVSRKKLAEMTGLPLSTVTTNISGVPKRPSYEIVEAVLYQFSDISAEWLMRGVGSMLISNIPADGDTDEMLNLKAENTRLIAENAELRDENQRLNERTDKLIDILYRDDEPQRKKA